MMDRHAKGGLIFSVILATRNRAQHLREALERLAGQQTQGAFTYEVLVVDNGSTDHTQQVITEFMKRFPVPLRCLSEGKVGKPYALNTALRDARGEFFAVTDDDILTTPTWLAALWRWFMEEHA
jgi:glycosyltransferase involved in cell wall biosynthesis